MNYESDNAPSLYVFENDLRLEDNQLFNQASQQVSKDNTSLLCIYCIQPWQFSSQWINGAAMGAARYQFLYQTLSELKQQLERHGLNLFVRVGHSDQVIKELHKKHQFSRIYHSQSAGYYERKQWRGLVLKLPEVDFETSYTGHLFQPSQLPFEISDLPKHFTPFRKQVEAITIHKPHVLRASKSLRTLSENYHWGKLPIPDNNHQNSVSHTFKGGAQAGQQHLKGYFSGELPHHYKEVRNQLLGWQNSTKFSPWLSLGCLSPRKIMHELQTYESKHGANDSTYWIYFELLWREFFHWNALKQGSQLFQSKIKSSESAKDSSENSKYIHWCQATTGEPLIDACMRQLNQTGYLSNRGRQIAASYLIHEMAADWRLGASYFERMLIDYDVASNWGNWQYIAGVGADPRGGRHFNVEKQQKTHDPNGDFINQWSAFKVMKQGVEWTELLS